jgi:hypothetical protein
MKKKKLSERAPSLSEPAKSSDGKKQEDAEMDAEVTVASGPIKEPIPVSLCYVKLSLLH